MKQLFFVLCVVCLSALSVVAQNSWIPKGANATTILVEQFKYCDPNSTLYGVDEDYEDIADELKDFKKVFINPEILEERGEKWGYEEGCLSIPGLRDTVYRHSIVKVKYLDENFTEYTEEFDGLRARIIQHEYDHLQGILFTDHLSAFRKTLHKGKLKRIQNGQIDADYLVKFK
ncbi:MAG TPA: peptide deformylase [Chitinophagales bacterium]|nr:peptide deformylase [Chitinophagales bacterium]